MIFWAFFDRRSFLDFCRFWSFLVHFFPLLSHVLLTLWFHVVKSLLSSPRLCAHMKEGGRMGVRGGGALRML